MDFKKFQEKYQKKKVIEYPNKVPSSVVVSVMVQTYQHRNYIKECLEGILKQETDFPFEILLGEDASTDGTREICIEYAEKYPQIIRLFLHHPENKIQVLKVPTGNFNALYNFYEVRGKYIAFCEGDDSWKDPLKIQKQVDFLNSDPSYVLTYHRFREEFEGNENRKPLKQPVTDLSKHELSRLIYHPLLSTICLKNIEKDLPEEIVEVLNVDSFILSLWGNYGKAKYLSEIIPSSYRRHSSGGWSSKSGELRLLLKLNTLKKLRLYYSNLNKPKLASHFQKQTNYYYKALSRHYFTNADLKNSLKYLFKTI